MTTDTFAAPWQSDDVAQLQRALVDKQLAIWQAQPHFRAFVDAVRATQCPGSVLEVGCGSGHGMELLRAGGVEFGSYTGIDLSEAAIKIARKRLPAGEWIDMSLPKNTWPMFDVVVDGSCLLHVEDWRAHIRSLCRTSRRWVILHRVPVTDGDTRRSDTSGYGQTFPAWRFNMFDIQEAMRSLGFGDLTGLMAADGDSWTMTFAKARHFVTYADGNYLGKLKALHASLVRHAGPFKLHVLAWDQKVMDWCAGASSVNGWRADDYLDWRTELAVDKLPGPPRSRVEHMWTVAPQFISDIMDRAENDYTPSTNGEPVTYLDADLYCFSSPEPVFSEIGGAPAAFVGHNFATTEQAAALGAPIPTPESHLKFGRYNVGMVHFAAPAIAQRWAALVRAWCCDRLAQTQEGRWIYADQTYLEILREEFSEAIEIKNVAAAPGPWGIHAHPLEARDGVIHFGGRPVVFFHFSSLVEADHGQLQYTRPEYAVSNEQKATIYAPYLDALARART